MTTGRAIIVVICLLLVSACDKFLYPRFDKGMWSNYATLQDVKPGMSKAEVIGIMGQPKVKEEATYDGQSYTFFFYQTHSMDYDYSETVRGGYTPVVFKDGRLVGTGKRAYRRTVERPMEAGGGVPQFPWEKTQ
jgi:outer membrane protein assembly factor BamE (lipoprotein component of BamABCDE complex)